MAQPAEPARQDQSWLHGWPPDLNASWLMGAPEESDSDWEGAGNLARVAQRFSLRRRRWAERIAARRRKLGAALDAGAQQIRDTANRTGAKLRSRRSRLRTRLAQISDRMMARLRSARLRRSRHKLTFGLVLVDVIVTAFLLGREPHNSFVWHTVKTVAFLGIRVVNYRLQRMHFYLMDFCYWPNMALLAYCWVFPGHDVLLRAAMGCCGLLLLSAVFFRNSLIFHSIDRVTCVYSHVSPPLTAWTLFWLPQPADTQSDLLSRWSLGHARSEVDRSSSVLGPAAVLYLSWALCYYSIQWILLKSTIETRNYDTLFKQMEQKHAAALERHGLLEHAKKVYVALHFTLFVLGLLWVQLSQVGQAAVIGAVVWATVWNGANYYIEHFWKVYEQLYREVQDDEAREEDDDMPRDEMSPRHTFTPELRPQRWVSKDGDWDDLSDWSLEGSDEDLPLNANSDGLTSDEPLE